MHPVDCAPGYDGELCSECTIVNGTKYERLADFECTKCPDPTLNAIRVVGLAIAITLFVVLLITVNIRKKRESQISILMRIMTNYLQVMTATIAYSMKFPAVLNQLFLPIERLGSSGETMMSFDCFAKNAQITLFFPSSRMFKNFMIAILPIGFFFGCLVIWGLLKFMFTKWFTDYKRNVVVSMVTILFLLHPTLTETALGMFQ